MTPLVMAAFFLWIALTGTSDIPLFLLGIGISFSLDWLFSFSISWKKAFIFLAQIISALVRAYREAFDLIFSHRYRRGYLTERIPDPSPWKIFTMVFLVTLTPKTVSIHVDHLNEMLIHRFEEEKQ